MGQSKKNSFQPMVKPEMLRMMNYYQSKFNSRVDSLLNRSFYNSKSKASLATSHLRVDSQTN